MLLINSVVTSFVCVCFFTGNIGFGGTATQTGMYGRLSASLALDGIGHHVNDSNCAHPLAPVNTTAHWAVDLGKRHQILNVTIYNRPSKFSCIVVVATNWYLSPRQGVLCFQLCRLSVRHDLPHSLCGHHVYPSGWSD